MFIVSAAESPPEVQVEWGYTWMWESLRLTGDDHWPEDAIADDACREVTVGSYIRRTTPTSLQ